MQTLSRVVIFERLLERLRDYAEMEEEIDVLELSQCVSMDKVTGYVFGSVNGTNFVEDVDSGRHWFEAYTSFKTLSPQKRAGGEIESSTLAMCEAAEASLGDLEEKASPSGSTRPVVFEQLSQRLRDSSGGSLTQSKMRVVASETLDHLIAGHESSAVTLTYFMYEMSLRPSLQIKLREEVLSLSPSLYKPSTTETYTDNQQYPQETDRLPKPSDIDSLPLLDSSLQETLRLHVVVPGPQPRVTPHSPTPTTIDGCTSIPSGVHVSCNAYTLHRNAEVFPSPETWLPERWLEADKDQRKEMMRWFWAFGNGGRMCIGNHFALQSRFIFPVVLP